MLENQYPYQIPLDVFIWVAVFVYIAMTLVQAYKMVKDKWHREFAAVVSGTFINLGVALFWPIFLVILVLSIPVFVIYKIIGKVKGEH